MENVNVAKLMKDIQESEVEMVEYLIDNYEDDELLDIQKEVSLEMRKNDNKFGL